MAKDGKEISRRSEYKALNSKLDRLERIALLGAKEALTVEEVALLTGLGKATIYRLITSKEIPHYKPEKRGKVYFKKSEIEDWLLQNKQKSNAEINIEATTHTTLKPKRYGNKS